MDNFYIVKSHTLFINNNQDFRIFDGNDNEDNYNRLSKYSGELRNYLEILAHKKDNASIITFANNRFKNFFIIRGYITSQKEYDKLCSLPKYKDNDIVNLFTNTHEFMIKKYIKENEKSYRFISDPITDFDWIEDKIKIIFGKDNVSRSQEYSKINKIISFDNKKTYRISEEKYEVFSVKL